MKRTLFIIHCIFVAMKLTAQTQTANYVMTRILLDDIASSSVQSVQYYDGLGRPTVLAVGGLASGGKYIYSLQEYDGNGRESTCWLPVSGGTMPVYMSRSDIVSASSQLYAADGTRLRTIHRTAVSGISVLTNNTHILTSAETLALDSTDYVGAFLFHGNSFNKYLFDDGYVTYTSSTPSMYFYLRDHQGNNRAVAKFATLSYENPSLSQTTYYYPYGGVFGDMGSYPESQPYKYNGKELDRMHGLDWYDYCARQYDPAIARFTSMDPLAEKYYHISPYAYCGGNPVNYVDPDGCNPIYSTNGILLGTADNGLQGIPIIMEKNDYKDGMSVDQALAFDLGLNGLIDEEAKQRFSESFKNLCKRPDWDGYITMKEANEWYRMGEGGALYADINKIDLSRIDFGERNTEQKNSINLLLHNIKDGLVYGHITFQHFPNNTVRAHKDTYDFDMKNWTLSTFARNFETIIGKNVAGDGKAFDIYIYGTKQLDPIQP